MKQRGFAPVLLVIVVALVAIVGAYYFGIKKGNLTSIPIETTDMVSTYSPNPVTDPTAKWKTYSSSKYGFSYKYPDGFEIVENDPGFFVITTTAENSFNGSLGQGISIDARLLGPYIDLNSARKSITDSIEVSENKKIDNWEVYQGIGKDGMLKGVEFRMAIRPYKTGVIDVETITNAKFLAIFDQVLTTFKFTQ